MMNWDIRKAFFYTLIMVPVIGLIFWNTANLNDWTDVWWAFSADGRWLILDCCRRLALADARDHSIF